MSYPLRMGFNEALLFVESILCAGVVISVLKLESERLPSVIAIGLILITLTGHKVITVFGHETNAGNVIYAAVFLATYLLVERRGRREGYRTVRWGILSALGFLAFLGLATTLVGSGETPNFDAALYLVFRRAPQVAFASLFAFSVSQGVNVYLYTYLKRRLDGRFIWIRANACNAVAQALDSVLFFMIAFVDFVPPPHVLDIIITGYLIKVVFMAAASPLLYLNRVEEEQGEGYASITFNHDAPRWVP